MKVGVIDIKEKEVVAISVFFTDYVVSLLVRIYDHYIELHGCSWVTVYVQKKLNYVHKSLY
jgi:hypothetical protein